MKNEYQTSVSLNYWMSMNFNGKDFAMADELLKYVIDYQIYIIVVLGIILLILIVLIIIQKKKKRGVLE